MHSENDFSKTITYIPDADVDAALDAALRELLSVCFIKPGDEVFRERRYYIDPPKHRWFRTEKNGLLSAHVAAHEKTVVASGQEMTICGIAEVCVHPDYRGRGFVREILKRVHDFMRAQGIAFSALAGDAAVYTSSGYRQIRNLYYEKDGKRQQFPSAMVCELGETRWPAGEVFLIGNFF